MGQTQRLIAIEPVPECVTEWAPKMLCQFQPGGRIQSSGFMEEVDPMPDVSAPPLVPVLTLRFRNKKTGNTEQPRGLADKPADWGAGFHYCFDFFLLFMRYLGFQSKPGLQNIFGFSLRLLLIGCLGHLFH